MSRVAYTREEVVIPKRPKLSDAAMLRIWKREDGVCWWCGKPVAQRGPDVRYDHKRMRELSGDDTEANIFPIHTDPCDIEKTRGEDWPMLHKMRRQRKLRLDVPKEKSKNPIRGRTSFPPGRKMQNRPFTPRRKPCP